MSDQMIELARRAVACPGWRWMAGMLLDCGERVPGEDSPYEWEPEDEDFPDLTDPATLGCLLHLVRKAWSDPGITTKGHYITGQYLWGIEGGHAHGAGFKRVANADWFSEAAALVAALEAAPSSQPFGQKE